MSAKSMMDLFPLTVEFATPLPQAIEQLGQEPHETIASCLLVMDGLELVGILTEWDLVRLLASGLVVDSKFTVADVMMQPVTTLRETELQEPFYALSLLRQRHIHHLPIVDSAAKLVGLITPTTIQQSLQPTNLLKLYRVLDVMSSQVPHADLHLSVLELAQLMMEHHANNVVIVDEAEQNLVPIGLVTARDILHLQARGGDLLKTSAQTIMQAPLFCLNPADSLWLACEEMRQRQVRCLVVTEPAGKLLGLVTQADLLRSLDPTEMQNSLRQLRQSIRQSETKAVDRLQNRTLELERVVQTRNAQLEEQAKCDRLLASTTLQIHRSLNLEETLNTTVSEVRKLLQTDRAIIYRLQPDGNGVVVMESVQPDRVSMLGKSIHDQGFVQSWLDAYQHGRIQAIDDIYKAGLSPSYINLLAEFQVRAHLVVPILSNQQLWGLLIAQHCDKFWRWQNWEIRLLEQLVKQVGIAIQQSELFQRVQMELSERQRLEGELARIFNLSPDLVGVIGVDGYLQRLNPAFTKTLGYTDRELLAEPLLHFVHLDDRAATQAALEQLASGEQPLSYFENRYRCRDETYKWLAWTAAPDDSTPGLIYTIARDITEQKESTARQATQFAVTQILAEATSLNEALPKLLAALCQGMSWEMGELWQSPDDRLHRTSIWHRDTKALTEFAALKQSITFAPGEGIPGQVWQTGKPIWVQDVVTDSRFFYPDVAIQAGLRSAIAFPLHSGKQITGVILCFSHVSRQRSEKLLERMLDIGQYINQGIEHKRAEQALQESEERLRLALDAAKVGIWDCDVRTGNLTWSQHNDALFGLSEGQFEGTLASFFACLHPHDQRMVQEAMAQALQHKTDYIQEFRVVWSDRSVHWLLSKGKVLCKAGEAIRMMGTFTDITERKQAEFGLKQANDELESKVEERTASWRQVTDQLLVEISERNRAETALTQTNAQLEAVLDAVPGLVSWVSADLRYLGVNRHLATTFNLPTERFLGQSIGFMDSSAGFHTLMQRFFASSTSTVAQETAVVVDGAERNYLIVAQKYDNSQAAVSVGIDITDRKQAERAVQESEAKFRNLVEQTNDWVWEINRSQRFTYLSPRVLDITGYEPQAMLNQRLYDFMLPDEAIRFSTVLEYALSQQKPFSQLETTILHQSGHCVVLELSGTPVFSTQGELQGYRGITRDITARKQVEQDIRVALIKEKELSELKTRFISMASHEFRTPLTTIQASAESIERYRHKWTEEKIQTTLHRIQNSVKHMTQLLNDVLILGKADAGKLEFKPTLLNLEEFCTDIVEELQLKVTPIGRVKFTKTGDYTQVYADEKLLRHILVNLLSNALKYSPLDSPVNFDLMEQSGMVLFQIQDRGIGISVADQKQLFESFYRASNVGNVTGTGLGLSIVKRSIEAHGGNITVVSEVGVGTLFTVTLPLIKS